MMRADVVVVGAGAAGLAAARRLTERGYLVALIEARERVGGRIATIQHPVTGIPLELGAEFVHGMPPQIFTLPAAALTLYEIRGDLWVAWQGNWRLTTRRAKTGDQLRDNIIAWQGADQSLSAFLAEQAPGNSRARRAIQDYIEGFDAADPDRVSIRWIAQTERAAGRISGERQFRPAGGYGHVVSWLCDSLPPERALMSLGSIVDEIRWSRGEVEVRAHGPSGEHREAISARAAVITLPLGVLTAAPDEAGAVRIVPALAEKRALYPYLAMGHVIKVLLHFREAFWETQTAAHPSLPGLSFLFTPGERFHTWWSAYPLVAPLLIGWIGGPRAVALSGEADATIIGHALTALAGAFGMPLTDLEALVESVHLHNWSTDPYSRGAYSYVYVDGVDVPRRLGEPVADTLFFAGEATNAEGHTGTVHGAMSTGYRAADEVVQALQGTPG